MKSKLAKRLCALALGLLVSLLAAEALVRARFGTPIPEFYPQVSYVPHPQRGFGLVPGDRGYTYDQAVRVNALGLRGPEVPPKEADEFRIFLLGDSLTFGHGIAEEKTIGAQLKQELERRFPLESGHYRVINGGHQGFDTRHEVRLLQELGETLQSDLVLMLWLWNDIQERVVPDVPPDTPLPPPRAVTAAPFSWTLRQWARKSALLLWLDNFNPDNGIPTEDNFDRALGKIDKHLLRFRQEIERLGARAAFVVLPDASGLIHPNLSGEIDTRAAELARGHGIEVLLVADEVRTLIQREGRLPVLPFDGHYSAEGNKAIAAGIARGLSASNLLERN